MPSYRVFLDPDGTWAKNWLAVVVEAKTGVVYANQCAGLSNEIREIEGFLVPLDGLKFKPEDGHLQPQKFTALFHETGACVGDRHPTSKLVAVLEKLVQQVPFWVCDGKDDERLQLKLDLRRSSSIAEAWVPVITPIGLGILM